MEVSTEKPVIPSIRALSLPLAGLQAGMIAAWWMLAWLGVSAVWQRRSFWTAENLLASVFYGGGAVHYGFFRSTIAGLALYLLIYSTLGCAFAAAARLRFSPFRLTLLAILCALAWYYISFHLIWKTLSPLIPLLYAERPTIIGHVIFGAILARYPKHVK
jgi:cation transport ATPase